jgi:hypothetical protein
VILVHAGANDITSTKCLQLSAVVRDVIEWIVKRLPSVTVIWSDMMSRLQWRGANDVKGVDKSRKRVNLAASQKVLSVGGRVIHHTDIDYTTPDLYRDDGVHLSDIGNDILLNDFQSGIETCITT